MRPLPALYSGWPRGEAAAGPRGGSRGIWGGQEEGVGAGRGRRLRRAAPRRAARYPEGGPVPQAEGRRGALGKGRGHQG